MQTIGGDQIALSAAEREELELIRSESLQQAVAYGPIWPVSAWLDYLNHLNPEHMELGLTRVRTVATRMGLYSKLSELAPTIVAVAGTNGKGSTATLIARALGKFMPTGLFTSPHLIHFNERIEIQGQPISDESLVQSLHQVVCAQLPCAPHGADAGDLVPLTYFEVVTLAAMAAFIAARCPLIVLEVGLGGRLDSTNIFEAQVAVITSIGLDHMKILGNTTTAIAREKAGIIKPHSTVILGANIDPAARAVILEKAQSEDASVRVEGVDFSATLATSEMIFHYGAQALNFSLPAVPFGCAGPALAAITTLMAQPRLQDLLPAGASAWERLGAAHDLVDAAVARTKLLGRMTVAPQEDLLYLDVAHNVPAAQHLVQHELPTHLGGLSKPWAVIGMLKDKDVEGVLAILQPHFARFFVGSLPNERGERAQRLQAALLEYGVAAADIVCADTIEEALDQALYERADASIPIVVVGSFVTVAAAWHYLSED